MEQDMNPPPGQSWRISVRSPEANRKQVKIHPGAGSEPCSSQVRLPLLSPEYKDGEAATAAHSKEHRQSRSVGPRGHGQVRRCAAAVSPGGYRATCRYRHPPCHTSALDAQAQRAALSPYKPAARYHAGVRHRADGRNDSAGAQGRKHNGLR